MSDLQALATEERADFLALLEQLAPEQWDAATLCPRWRVRDVAAHVFSYDELSRAELVWRFVRGGLAPSRVNAACLAPYRDSSPPSSSPWPGGASDHEGSRPRSEAASRWSTG